MVAERSFPVSLCEFPCLPPLWSPTPPSSLTCLLLLYLLSLVCLLLALSGIGRDVGALPQTLVCHAGAVGLAELASCRLACRRWPALAAGIDSRAIR